MTRNFLNILCRFRPQTRFPIQPAQHLLLYTRYGISTVDTLTSRCATIQTQHSFKSTYHSSNVETSPSGEHRDTKTLLKEEGFIPIYRLNNAHMFAAINKVKWQQLYLTLGGLSLSIIGCSLGLVSIYTPPAVICIGGMISTILWALGFFVKNTVGVILVSPDEERVCISYINNKGRRQNDIFPVDDLVPLEELSGGRFTQNWWIYLRRYSSLEGEYRLFLQMCEVTDAERFSNVLGRL